MKASAFQKKYSVVFVQPNGKASQPFYFFNRYDPDTVAQTWQVLRSEFDQMLLDNARDKGAVVRTYEGRLPAVLEFDVPHECRSFTLEVAGQRFTQPLPEDDDHDEEEPAHEAPAAAEAPAKHRHGHHR
jgi:hypothetical protein